MRTKNPQKLTHSQCGKRTDDQRFEIARGTYVNISPGCVLTDLSQHTQKYKIKNSNSLPSSPSHQTLTRKGRGRQRLHLPTAFRDARRTLPARSRRSHDPRGQDPSYVLCIQGVDEGSRPPAVAWHRYASAGQCTEQGRESRLLTINQSSHSSTRRCN